MKTEAERKALQRQGWRARTVWTHTATTVNALLAEGLITDAEIENPEAIDEALSQFVMRHSKTGRFLRDGKAERNQKAQARVARPKAQRQDKPKHGRVTHWTPEEIEAYEGGKSRRWSISNCRPSYSGHIAGDPVSWPEDGAIPTHLGEFPPDWSGRGRSGDRDGRNRSRITGARSKKELAARKIKQLDDKALKRDERPYADVLKVESTSPHFVQTSARELRSMHGLDSTRQDTKNE